MPEMLEVECYRLAADEVVGRKIASVRAPDDWFTKGETTPGLLAAVLPGRVVTRTRRIGKLLLLDTDGPVLGLRFGMTGRIVVDASAPIEVLEYSSDRDDPAWDRFGLEFVGGGSLAIRDPRRLGGVELDPDEARLGPDAGRVTRKPFGEILTGPPVFVLMGPITNSATVDIQGSIPNDLALVDSPWWGQGAFIDMAPHSNDPVRLTNGLRLELGAP